jgi:hypothetical protein
MHVKIAINRSFKGKPKGETLNDFFKVYNGRFENVELTAGQLAHELRQGYGITTQHRNYRKAANFICGQHLGLDFDTGDQLSSIDRLLQDPFIAEYASILYTTPSHTAEQPRARVIFLLDRPVYDPAEYGRLAAALLWQFDQADPQCKDPARLFFGAGDPARVVVRLHKCLPLDIMRGFAAAHALTSQASQADQADGRRVVLAAENAPAWLLESHSSKLLAHVRTAPDGQKHYILRDISRTFGGYVAGGFYTFADCERWLQAAIRANPGTVNSLAAADKTITEGLEYGQRQPLHFTTAETQPAAAAVPELKTSPAWRKKARPDSQQERVIFPAGCGLRFPPGAAKPLPDGRIEAWLTLTQLQQLKAYSGLSAALA